MGSRTVIKLAAGIITGQNRCTQEESIRSLRDASSHRNVKLRDIAAELVTSVGPLPGTQFEN